MYHSTLGLKVMRMKKKILGQAWLQSGHAFQVKQQTILSRSLSFAEREELKMAKQVNSLTHSLSLSHTHTLFLSHAHSLSLTHQEPRGARSLRLPRHADTLFGWCKASETDTLELFLSLPGETTQTLVGPFSLGSGLPFPK